MIPKGKIVVTKSKNPLEGVNRVVYYLFQKEQLSPPKTLINIKNDDDKIYQVDIYTNTIPR